MKLRILLVTILMLLLILLSLPSHAALEEVLCFGPQTYEREKGKPFTETDTFTINYLSDIGQLIIHNGGSDKKTRVSSAEIWFNGNLIFRQNDFNKNVERLVAEVHLAENNEITVKLNGKPGIYLTAEVVTWVDSPNPGDPILMDGAVLYSGETPIETTIMEYETDEGIVLAEAAIGRVIVQFHLDVRASTAESLITTNGGFVIEKIPNIGFYVADVPPGSELNFVDIMNQYASVNFADIDFVLTDAQYTGTPREGIDDRPYLRQIKAPEAWEWVNEWINNRTQRGEPTIERAINIGIIDNGFNHFKLLAGFHRDFIGRWRQIGDLPFNTTGEHGQLVTAVAAATGNTADDDECDTVPSGICGNIGIDWTSRIALSQRGVLISSIIELINLQVSEGIDVINISTGIGNNDGICDRFETSLILRYFERLSSCIENLNNECRESDCEFIVVSAAGNEGCSFGRINKPENLIIVGGANGNFRHTGSNYGANIDIAAPWEIQEYYSYANNQVLPADKTSGTSVSAPQIAGAAALVWSYDDSHLIAEEVVERLKVTALGEIPEFGDAGVLDIYEALDKCPDTPDDETPNQYGCSISQLVVDLDTPPINSPDVPPSNINFKWHRLDHTNESSFEYCISIHEDSEPDDIPIWRGCELGYFNYNNEVQFSLEPGKKYYWSVRARDPQGHLTISRDAGDWWSFTTTCADSDSDTFDACEPGELGDDGKPKDCKDEDASINPGADETCDGVNNDCNPATPDGSAEAWLGAPCDGSDTDLCPEGSLVCSEGAQICNDNTADNVEICDGLDNDCNPSTADGAAEPWIGDACDGSDSDQCMEGSFICSSGGQVCNDNTGDNVEICDDLDNDCDGQVDEDVTTIFYLDSDYDDYGDSANSIQDCLPPAGYIADNTDCDDANSSVYPNAPEICDVIDNQCPGDPGYGQVDEGCDEDIPRNGLVAFYPFSGNANDESGNENHGTVYGAVLSKDRFGNDNQAYYFDGVDDYIEVADDPTLNFGIGDFTINAWVKTNYAHFLPSIVIIDKRTHTDGFWYGYVLFHIEDGRIGFQLADGGYSNWFSHLLITTDKWQLITVTVDRDVEIGGIIYVNGQIIHTFPTSYDTGSLDNISNLFIAQNLFGSNHFRGNIDDISMYNRVLSDEEVQTLFHIGQIEDYDGDGVIDTLDNCPEDFNPGQDDADDNGIGDYCELPSLRALPDTGQVSSYTETFGEDSDYNSNQPSFTKLDINGNALPYSSPLWPMVRDNVTGLTWETKTVDGSIHDRDNKYNWQDAQDNFIFQLNADQFGGFNDWRLPNIKELLTIVNREINPNSGIPVINTDFFSNTIKGYYWSSTLTADTGTGAWTTNFYYGLAQPPGVGSLNPVRAVRGAPYGENNFIVGEGFVTDTKNGLMWQQETIDPMTWEETLSYCEDLQLSGYDDWRLPSINELHSIVDYSVINPSIDSTVFPDTVPNSIYWSSTTTPHASNHAWSIRFTAGYVYAFTKTDTVYLDLTIYGRCVRGGQN